MRFDGERKMIYMSVTELAGYAYQRENPKILEEKYGFIKKSAISQIRDDTEESVMNASRYGNALHNSAETDSRSAVSFVLTDTTQTEVPLEKEIVCGECAVSVQGYADIISFDGILYTIEEIKTVKYFPAGLSPFSDPSHFAQAAVYAYMFAESMALGEVKIKLTYIKRSNGDRITFTAKFTCVSLSRMFDALISRAYPFINITAERHTVFPNEAKKLPFPYTSIREGQLEFVKAAHRTIRHRETLLVSAPTGIGKTMSSLFPAVKAVGDGYADKIFYLTAKTVTGKAALDAAHRLQKYAPHLYSIMLGAKEMICPFKRKKTDIEAPHDCLHCEMRGSISEDFGKSSISYRERELSALRQLLGSDDHVYTTERIIKTSADFSVCPHELALDLSESCVIIVCDYNYVLDDNVRLKRYFKNIENNEKYVFLFDEAHNIPDRTRNVYSSVLKLSTADALISLAEGAFTDEDEFCERVGEYRSALLEIREMCTENEYLRTTDKGEIRYGFYESGRIPDELVRSASNLARLLAKIIRDNHDVSEILEPYSKEIAKAAFVSAYFDEKFRFFASRENDSMTAEILCIDPSGIIGNMLSAACAVIMFSATLSPMEYFAQVTGLEDAEALELDSPYERENLCLIAYDSISTRLGDRKDTAYECAEVIAETVSARDGNYIVYFPSYDYMKKVCRLFAGMMPECGIVMQKQGMSYREREKFISIFSDESRGSVVGFCVLGGMFSEGIDLAGESLIGTIIFGTGMPQISAERNIMSAYYDEICGSGYEYAYTCPGMNKVLQAAGRVIRSESDRGVVVIVDDRLGEPNMKLLFPPHWRHMKYTGDTESLRAILDMFWEEK